MKDYDKIIDDLCSAINEAFKEPFMPDGFVVATNVTEHCRTPAMKLRIGTRSVVFMPTGDFIA